MPKFPPLRLRSAFNLGGLTPWELVVRTWHKLNEHELMTRASAIAFYAMLAMVPFLALVITLAARLLPTVGRDRETLGVQTVSEFETTIRPLGPTEAYGLIEDQIERIQEEPPVGLLSVGLLITLWLASIVFLEFINAMNRIYGVEETRPIWKLRLVAIAMTLIQAVVLLGSLLVIVLWPQILNWLGMGGVASVLATVVQWVVVFVMILLSFALTFYVAPDAEVRWEWITPGSLAGTIVFIIASLLFRVYVQNFGNYNETYGSLGGVMVILFWFWIAALIVLTAAEVNKVIEHASPLGKSYGQKKETGLTPDYDDGPSESSSASSS